MTFIIMCKEETGEETRVGPSFNSAKAAYKALPEYREKYPEWYGFHVEKLRGAAYWAAFYARTEAQGYAEDY